MENNEILQHLLDLERQAAALVDDAQAEADRRIAEGESRNRLSSDEIYARELKALEEIYKKNITAAKESYKRQLDDYMESLKTQALNTDAFRSLAEKLLHSPVMP